VLAQYATPLQLADDSNLLEPLSDEEEEDAIIDPNDVDVDEGDDEDDDDGEEDEDEDEQEDDDIDDDDIDDDDIDDDDDDDDDGDDDDDDDDDNNDSNIGDYNSLDDFNANFSDLSASLNDLEGVLEQMSLKDINDILLKSPNEIAKAMEELDRACGFVGSGDEGDGSDKELAQDIPVPKGLIGLNSINAQQLEQLQEGLIFNKPWPGVSISVLRSSTIAPHLRTIATLDAQKAITSSALFIGMYRIHL
jgi:hypothetical protein